MEHTNTNTNEPAPYAPNTGDNPHAEIDAEAQRTEQARSAWRERPRDFVGLYGGDSEALFGAISGLLDGIENPRTEAEALARLLDACAEALRYRIRSDSRWISFGPLAIPTSPRGLEILAALREYAGELVTGQSPRSVLDDTSALARLLDEIERTARMRRSGILETARNRTSAASEVAGFRIGFGFHARALASMPNGNTLPPAILGAALVGREIDGDEAREMREHADMCDSGTAEFLDRFGISYETEGGEYECDSCGSTHDDDEGGSISWISDFTLTGEMLDAIDTQGFGDSVREFFGAEDGCDEWSGMLDACDNAEILARCAPNKEDGIRYDSSVWRFVPDFEGIDGLDGLEWSEQARALPLLVEIARAHEEASVLPPISGTLEYQRAPHESRSTVEPKSYDFQWNAEAGTLTHTIAGPLALRVSAKHGGASIVHTIDGAERIGTLTPIGSEFVLDAPAYEGGERAARLLGIVKGSAGI